MHIRREFFRYVIPSMLAFALSGIYAIADGFFVGNALGDDALAAVNIAFPLTAFLQAVGTGIGMGGAIEYAIHAGSKHESRGKQYMGMSIVLLGGCSILFTFSCSQVVNKQDFRNAVFTAAAQSGRSVRILHQLTQPGDHPVNIYHPEGEYLKGLVLYVE